MLLITQGESGREFTLILEHEQAVILNRKAVAHEMSPSDYIKKVLELYIGKSRE